MEARRRVTLYDQMSASDSSRDSLAGLTLDEILANQKRSAAPSQQPLVRSRTLLDIIKEDESNRKDRKSWKAFKDKLRLKRAGSAWTSSIHVPASDVPIPIQNNRALSQFSRRNSVRFQTHSNSDVSTQYMAHQPEDIIDPTPDSDAPAMAPATRAQFSRRSSTRYGSPLDAQLAGDSSHNAPKLRPQMSRRDSSTVPSHAEPFRRGRLVTFRDSFDDDDDKNPETGRALSAREAVAAQEASEAAAAAEAAAEEEESSGVAEDSATEPVRMSLMDLLEETDREMGFEGSRYMMSDDEDFEDNEDEGEDEDEEEEEGVVEYNCCVCMVRHKGAAFIPCGHTFCRMCSRELFVSRGNCPLCNNFILEILDIF